jgi:hypothetical protein
MLTGSRYSEDPNADTDQGSPKNKTTVPLTIMKWKKFLAVVHKMRRIGHYLEEKKANLLIFNKNSTTWSCIHKVNSIQIRIQKC